MRILLITALAVLLHSSAFADGKVVGWPSAPTETAIFHWDGSSAASGSIIVAETTPTFNSTGTPPFTTGYSGDGYEPTDDNFFTWTNMDDNVPSTGTIEFWMKQTGTALSYAAVIDLAPLSTLLGRKGVDTSKFRIRPWDNSATADMIVEETPWDGDWHFVEFSWNDTDDTLKIRVDSGTVVENDLLTFTVTTGQTMVLACYVDGTSGGLLIDEFKIYDTDNL